MLGKIDGLPAPEGPQRTRQNETRRSTDTAQNRASNTADRIEVSKAAQETQETVNRLQEAARQLSDIREDRVAQARARIAAGDYDAENVRRIIADRILNQFGLSDS